MSALVLLEPSSSASAAVALNLGSDPAGRDVRLEDVFEMEEENTYTGGSLSWCARFTLENLLPQVVFQGRNTELYFERVKQLGFANTVSKSYYFLKK